MFNKTKAVSGGALQVFEKERSKHKLALEPTGNIKLPSKMKRGPGS